MTPTELAVILGGILPVTVMFLTVSFLWIPPLFRMKKLKAGTIWKMEGSDIYIYVVGRYRNLVHVRFIIKGHIDGYSFPYKEIDVRSAYWTAAIYRPSIPPKNYQYVSMP